MPPTARRLTTASIKQLLVTHPFDLQAWEGAVAQDLHVRIGNAAPGIGKHAALAELNRFFARITSVGMAFCEMCRCRETLFAEMEVEFKNEAGLQQRIPCVIVVRVGRGALLDVRFDLDPSPIPPMMRTLGPLRSI